MSAAFERDAGRNRPQPVSDLAEIISTFMALGGKRPGAGRPKGKPTQRTLEKRAITDAFNQRVMNAADALFNAQLSLATGSMKVFRIDEEETDGGKVKRVHVHVTDADEIKALLDQHEGSPGVVDGVYYYFSDVLPDNRAIDSLLNRALGKPTEHLKVEQVDMPALAQNTLNQLVNEYGLDQDSAKSIVASEFGDILDSDLASKSVS